MISHFGGNMDKKHLTAVILAAGSSTRMGGCVKKQMLPILGKTVLWRTLSAFEACELVDSVVLAAHMDDIEYISDKIAPEFKKIKRVIAGGNTRAESARLSFEALPKEPVPEVSSWGYLPFFISPIPRHSRVLGPLGHCLQWPAFVGLTPSLHRNDLSHPCGHGINTGCHQGMTKFSSKR